MKTLVFAVLLASTNLFAQNARVGDSATLVGTLSGQTIITNNEIIAYDANEDKYLMASNVMIPGQGTFTQNTELTADELMTPEKGQLIVVMCPQVGGVVEEIDLSMGRFTTCKLPVQNAIDSGLVNASVLAELTSGDDQILKGAMWLGKFPISGIARIITPEQSFSLENFKWSN